MAEKDLITTIFKLMDDPAIAKTLKIAKDFADLIKPHVHLREITFKGKPAVAIIIQLEPTQKTEGKGEKQDAATPKVQSSH